MTMALLIVAEPADLLASLAYPSATKGIVILRSVARRSHIDAVTVDQLRAGCDLMNLFFVFDEYSDVEDEHTVQTFADVIMDALRNPHKARPAGEPVLGEIARQCVFLTARYEP